MRSENWIQTYLGHKFWPTDPRPEDIHIVDIAHALSMKCRYTGHCMQFYSVAQHCVIATRLVQPIEHKRWVLMHDSAEAYLPDIARPIKKEITGFKQLEENLLKCIAEKFQLSWPMPHDIISSIDIIMLATEKRDVMRSGVSWGSIDGIQTIGYKIVPWSQEFARTEFLKTYRGLFNND